MEGIIDILVLVSVYLLVRARNRKKDFKQLHVDFQVLEARLKRAEKGLSRTKVRELIQDEVKELYGNKAIQLPDNQDVEEKRIEYQRPEKVEVPTLKIKPKIEEKDTEHIPSFSFDASEEPQ